MRIYLAGPMRGRLYYNFLAFDEAAQHLRRLGADVISPADMDREAGFDATKLPLDHDWTAYSKHFDKRMCVLRDVKALVSADAIVMLENWEQSSGALLEVGLGRWLGIPCVPFVSGISLAYIEGETEKENHANTE